MTETVELENGKTEKNGKEKEEDKKADAAPPEAVSLGRLVSRLVQGFCFEITGLVSFC